MLQEVITLKSKDVARVFQEAEVQKNTRKKKFRPYKIDVEPVLSTDEGLPLMQRCQKVLGKRMEQRWQGYYLDGKPASSSKIAQAAGFEMK